VPDQDRTRDRLKLHLCWLLVHLPGGLGR